jgi:hypothetical protein
MICTLPSTAFQQEAFAALRDFVQSARRERAAHARDGMDVTSMVHALDAPWSAH